MTASTSCCCRIGRIAIPLELFKLLKRHSDYFNYNQRTLGDFTRDAKRDGLRATLDERANGARCGWRRAISPTSAATRTRIS